VNGSSPATAGSFWLAHLSRCLRQPLGLADPRGQVRWLTEDAAKLLGVADAEELGGRWPELADTIAERAAASGGLGEDGITIPNVLPPTAPGVRLKLELFPVPVRPLEEMLVVFHDGARHEAMKEHLWLASRSRSLSVFQESLIHDLRAPLNAMALNLELLRTHLDTTGREPAVAARENQQTLEVLQREIQRMKRMLGSLARDGRGAHVVRRFSLKKLLADTLAVLRGRARRQGVRFHLERPAARVTVRAPRDRLEEALLNLEINALEAMTSGGTVEVDLECEGTRAVIRIRDRGEGIPEHLRERVFDLHVSTKKGGSGIGLSLAREVVRELGGDLRLLPREDGPGTEAVVTLPRCE
jgi:signal transduction histidine kinase